MPSDFIDGFADALRYIGKGIWTDDDGGLYDADGVLVADESTRYADDLGGY